MAKRLKVDKTYGIRPHMFHYWLDEVAEAIEMQHQRVLEHNLPADAVSAGGDEFDAAVELMNRRAAVDFDFYFVALRRLLRIAEEATAEGYGDRALKDALKDFRAAVPGLLAVRDSAEHPDDWLRTGRTRNWGIGLGGGEASFTHGNDHFELGPMTAAARALSAAVRTSVPQGAPEKPGPPLQRGERERAVKEATWVAPRRTAD
jgi:hypothetical protein